MSKPSSKPSASSCQAGCSPSGGCKVGLLLLHSIFTTVYAYSTYRAYFGPAIPVHKPQGVLLGPLKYLTIWDLHFQLLAGILNVLVLLTSCQRLTAIRDAVHHGISFPFGVSVCGLFWSIYAVDRRLVFPKELDVIIPFFVNHILHTLVGVTPIFSEFTTYQQRKRSNINIYFAIFTLYIIQLLFFGDYLDFWIYPIFDVLTDVGRFGFLGFCVGLGSLIYTVHGALHSFLWNERIKDSKKKRM